MDSNENIVNLEVVEKYNPYHDKLGRFTTSNGAQLVVGRTKDGKKQVTPGKANDKDKNKEKPKVATASGKKENNTKEEAKSEPKKEKREVTIFRNTTLAYGEKEKAEISDLMNKAPKECLNAWNKHMGDVTVFDTEGESGTRYKGGLNSSIFVNAKKDMVGRFSPKHEALMHESGHAIDNNMGGKRTNNFISVTYKDGIFEKTLMKEAKAALGSKEWDKRMKEYGTKDMLDVCDIVYGAKCLNPSIGKYRGIVEPHPESYWKNGSGRLAKEAFAGMFSATVTNPNSLKHIKEVFPESYNIFMEIMATA